MDKDGNLYIAVYANPTGTFRWFVRKVNPAGVITTVAGNASAVGYSGDGGPATSAGLDKMDALAVDLAGDLYMTQFNTIRKVSFRSAQGLPGIELCTTSLSFSSVTGASPASQSLGITNSGMGTLSWTASATTSSGGNWLTITPSAGTAPGLPSVWVDSAALGAGTYSGTITISGVGATNSPQSIMVQLTVGATVAPPPAGTPTFTGPAITNAASFLAGVTPGSIVTIFGTGFTKGVDGVVLAEGLPLPTNLRGTSVTVGGTPAPLFAIANAGGQEQINLQIPYEAAREPIAIVVVNNNGVAGVAAAVVLLLFQPGVFTLDGTTGVILHGENNQLVSASAPARKGEVVVLYATGLGPVSPEARTGFAAPSDPPSRTTILPVVTVGNANAEVLFSGLAPGFVGLYQLNVRIPKDARSGIQPLIIKMEGVSSKFVTLAIQ